MSRVAFSVAATRRIVVAVSILAAVALLGCGTSTPTATVTATKPGTTTTATKTVTATATGTATKPVRHTRSTPPSATPFVTLALKAGDVVVCSMTADGATCPLTGTAEASPGMEVLLWVEPVHPKAETFPAYYIQRRPAAGVTRQPRPGASSPWEGAIQIGNTQYPPHRGDTLTIIATLAVTSAAVNLLGATQQTYPDPAGAPEALAHAEARDVIVTVQ
jgi:hypothetical protein